MINSHASALFGIWLGMLSLPGQILPFNFDFHYENGKPVMIIHNAEERIKCEEITVSGDSMFIKLPVFDSEFRVKVSDKKMNGYWINYGKKDNPQIPFNAEYNIATRFPSSKKPVANVEGRWEAYFDTGTPDSSLAIGIFKQMNEKVTGTFLTETGDHRYLEGIVNGDSLLLSVFDGSHCWLYKAKVSGGKMEGIQWSALAYNGKWKAQRNETIMLRDAETISRIDAPLDFTFPDTDSNMVSLKDQRFKNKVIILQIMGSWCPNCMDETAFLAEYYKKHHAEGLEIIGLAFERFPEFAKASANVKRVVKKFDVQYPVLIAGISGKENVMKTLPQIKDFISFPTMIFIGRDGNMQEVHAGFSGPATGIEYKNFIIDFEKKVNKMLK